MTTPLSPWPPYLKRNTAGTRRRPSPLNTSTPTPPFAETPSVSTIDKACPRTPTRPTNSPALTCHGSPTTTCVNNNVSFTTQLLNEFNAQQECHISVLSTSLVQYIPSFPTPSMQEVALLPPLHIHINPNPKGPHLPMLPSTAKTILCMDVGDNL